MVSIVLSEEKITEYALQLGKQIRIYRKAADLTQPQLAEMAGINSKFLSEVERGKTTLTVSRLIQIAAALNISIATLIEPLVDTVSPVPKEKILNLLEADIKDLSEHDLVILYRLACFLKTDKISL